MVDDVKPPYVKFETRSIEDRAASVDAGHYVGKDTIFAIVTPAGTKDRIEREAEDWLKNVEEGVKQERIPEMWLAAYRRALEDYKHSRDTPEFGTPIKDWPSASPAQINTLLAINIRTVEELASAHEEALQTLGMGGRALKQKAQIWLDSSNDQGKIAQEIDQLRVENKELKERDGQREARLQLLEGQIASLTKEKVE